MSPVSLLRSSDNEILYLLLNLIKLNETKDQRKA